MLLLSFTPLSITTLSTLCWPEGFSPTLAWSKAGVSLGPCGGCKGQVGHCCFSSSSAFTSTVAPRIPSRCHCSWLLHQCYQSCCSDNTGTYLPEPARQCLKAPEIDFFFTVPSLFINKCDISFAPSGWKLSLRSGYFRSLQGLRRLWE